MVLWNNKGRIARWLFENADAKKGWSAGLSEERAGEASNLMRRPVQRGSRNATTSACVGWDFANIENRPAFRKEAWCRHQRRWSRLKRLHHHQNNDSDHQDRRYLIDKTVE